MKDRNKIIIGVASVAALLGLTLLIVGQKKKVRFEERLDKIADEGYETAGDILYPLKSRAFKSNWELN